MGPGLLGKSPIFANGAHALCCAWPLVFRVCCRLVSPWRSDRRVLEVSSSKSGNGAPGLPAPLPRAGVMGIAGWSLLRAAQQHHQLSLPALLGGFGLSQD